MLTLLKVSEKRLSYHPLMPSMTTLSENEWGIVCTEHLRELVLIKSSVNKKNILNDEKFFFSVSDIKTKSKCIYNKHFANRLRLFDQLKVC